MLHIHSYFFLFAWFFVINKGIRETITCMYSFVSHCIGAWHVQTEYWNVVCMYLRVLEYWVEPHPLFGFLLQSQHWCRDYELALLWTPMKGSIQTYSKLFGWLGRFSVFYCWIFEIFLVALLAQTFLLCIAITLGFLELRSFEPLLNHPRGARGVKRTGMT